MLKILNLVVLISVWLLFQIILTITYEHVLRLPFYHGIPCRLFSGATTDQIRIINHRLLGLSLYLNTGVTKRGFS